MSSSRASRTWIVALAIVASAMGGVVAVAGSAGASPTGCTVHVTHENGNDTAVQAAITAAPTGATVCVGPGVYPEQLVIKTAGLHLKGAGTGRTSIDPTTGVANAVDYDNGKMPLVAVVQVDNVSRVAISGLTVNAGAAAASIGGCSPGIVGIDFQNVSSGTLTNAAVKNAELAPALLGCQSQTAVYAYTGYFATHYTPVAATVTVTATTITAYGKGGVVCDDPGLSCVVRGDRVVGIGPTPAIASNGIQVAFGATATVLHDFVSGNDYTGALATNDFYGNGYNAAGILLYQAGAGTSVRGSTVVANQIGIVGYQDVADVIRGNTVTNSYAYGIVEYGKVGFTATIQGNVVRNPGTGAVGILVANGTFSVVGNTIIGVSATGTNGASQAITGNGTIYPTAAAVSIATAAFQAISDGGTTIVHLHTTTYRLDVARTATAAVFGGTVAVGP